MSEPISPISNLVSRRLAEVASERLRDEPVIALEGPRTVGKSTLLAQLARAHGATVLDLDDPAVRDAVADDPGAFVAGAAPVFVDEYQHVPLVLDAIKAECNRALRPGRFVIAGSTRYDALPLAAQSLTGRLHLLTVWPLTQGEIDGRRENLLEALLDDPERHAPRGTVSRTSREEYIERIVAGGMPVPLGRATPAGRSRWFGDYLRLVIERDVREISSLRRRERVPPLLERLAAQTAGVLNMTTAAARAELDRSTASEYLKLLEAVFVVSRLPAWGTTLASRAARAPKIHVVDSGVAAHMLRLAPQKLARRDPASLSQFGRLLESFVVGELTRHASWLDDVAICGHWRTHDGEEVDLIVERSDGRVLAFEVKAAGRVAGTDLRHLRRLRDVLGERFQFGAILYIGPYAYRAEERLHVLPVDRLWWPV